MERLVPIRLGQVGGGAGAFIGAVHRIAARLDGQFALVAGALSSTPDRAAESAAAVGIAPDRAYSDWAEMAEREAARDDGIEAVAICTPNHLHVPVARAFLERGIHVICDKPLAASLAEAKELRDVAEASAAAFVLTHNYSGYPLVREAKAMVARGRPGHDPGGAGRISAGLDDRPGRGAGGEAGRVARRSRAGGAGRRDGGYRHPCLSPGALRHRAETGAAGGGPVGLRAGPGAGRQRPCDAALRGRRQGHALVQPGGAGARERAAPAGLRRPGRPGLVPGGPERALAHAPRRGAAAADAGRAGDQRGRHAGAAGTPGGVSGGLRQYLRRCGAPDPRPAGGKGRCPRAWTCPISATGWRGWPSSPPAWPRSKEDAAWTGLDL